MLKTYIPSESELMEEAHRLLQKRIAVNGPSYPAGDTNRPQHSVSRAPTMSARRKRSLQTCHRYTLFEKPRHPVPKDKGAYVPELSARLENDRNVTDGARRCARKLAEIIYRQNRKGRFTEITVTYLMKALHRSRRTIQRYLRLLEREGYIHTQVIRGARSRLCTGLLIALGKPILARHHAEAWPVRRENPGASKESQNKNLIDSGTKGERLSVRRWALLCMDGVFRAFMKTDPLGLMETSPPLKA